MYVFSRRRVLSQGMTTREMAEDLNDAMDALGLSSVSLVGVSQGGMISQWLAIDHPEKVEKLVLTVTLSRPNDTVRDVICRWVVRRVGDLCPVVVYCGVMSGSCSIFCFFS